MADQPNFPKVKVTRNIFFLWFCRRANSIGFLQQKLIKTKGLTVILGINDCAISVG